MAIETDIAIDGIFISGGHDFKGRHEKGRLAHGTQRVESVECIAGKGLKGDRYFGFGDDYKGQVTFIDKSVMEGLGQSLGIENIDATLARRNVLIGGADLGALIGKRFSIGDAVFTGSEEAAPCHWMDKAIGEGAYAYLKGRGGLRCRIVKSGTISCGVGSLVLLGE